MFFINLDVHIVSYLKKILKQTNKTTAEAQVIHIWNFFQRCLSLQKMLNRGITKTPIECLVSDLFIKISLL